MELSKVDVLRNSSSNPERKGETDGCDVSYEDGRKSGCYAQLAFAIILACSARVKGAARTQAEHAVTTRVERDGQIAP